MDTINNFKQFLTCKLLYFFNYSSITNISSYKVASYSFFTILCNFSRNKDMGINYLRKFWLLKRRQRAILLQTFSYCNGFLKIIEWLIIVMNTDFSYSLCNIVMNTDFSYSLCNLHAVRRWLLVWSLLYSDLIQSFHTEFASYCRANYLPFHGRK